MMAVGLKLDLVRFWSSGLVEMSMFSWDFEVVSWLRFWRWNLSKLCVRTHDMTSRSYFGKMNSTLRSVVPLAMFLLSLLIGLLCLMRILSLPQLIARTNSPHVGIKLGLNKKGWGQLWRCGWRRASEGFAFIGADLLRQAFATDLCKGTTITSRAQSDLLHFPLLN